jgi:hypothetical protein
VVAEGVRRVSAAIITGIFTLLGVALGLFGERYIRERRRVHCEVDAWTGAENPSYGAPEVRHFATTFYNNKDVALALWDVRMEFVPADGDPESVKLRNTSAGDQVDVFNLPPRMAVSEVMQVTAGGETLHKIKHARALRFAGTFPGGKEFSKDLPRWDST